jgi:hypothetical protein
VPTVSPVAMPALSSWALMILALLVASVTIFWWKRKGGR